MKTPTIGHYIDQDEQDLIEQIERDSDKFVSTLTPELANSYQQAAEHTLNRSRVKISLRVREVDLNRLKARAVREGIPYQTLINSILHKAVHSEQA